MINEFEIGDYFRQDFKIIDKYGGEENSAFGIVYIVDYEPKHIVFALKTLQWRWLDCKEVLDDFKKEVLILTNLNHPNVIKTAGVDFVGNQPYMMMEPIIPINNKISLSDYFGELDIETILDWSIQFCHGMEYINEHEIIAHCDIKPDNILIQLGLVKISDFGLIELSNKYSLVNGSYKGTYAYMAPETFKNEYTVQTDVYAFGVVLYQMVNDGVLPFNSSSSSEDVWKSMHGTHEVPNFDSDLYDIILKCLEKEPQNRYSSFKELRFDLEEISLKKNLRVYDSFIDNETIQDYYGKAHTFAKYGYVKEAERIFDSILMFKNIPCNVLVECGICLIEIKSYDKSILFLNKALDLNNSEYHTKILFNLAHAYHLKGNLEEGLNYYDETINCDDTYLMAYVNKGNILKDLNKFSEAMWNYNHVLEIKNDCWQANFNKAITLSYFEDLENMNLYFKRSLGKNDEVVYNEWGEALRRNNREVDAMLKFDKSIQINKKFSIAHYNMILSYLIQERYEFAIDYYDKNKNFFDLYQKRDVANAFGDFGVFDKSIEICNYIIQNTENLILQSEIFSIKISSVNSIKMAKQYFNKSISLFSENICAYLNLGEFYLKKGLDKCAVKILKKGLQYDSNNFYLLLKIGIGYFKLENFNLAKKYFLKAKDIDEYNEEVYLWLISSTLFIYGDGTGLELLFDEAKSKNLLKEFDSCVDLLDSIYK